MPERPNEISAPVPRPILRLFRVALAASLALSALLYFLWSWRWPLVGDSAIIHYIAFLLQRGWVPYSQISDQQFPGTYLIEIAAMHLFGPGDLGWRLFDFTLLAIASFSFFVVTRESSPATSQSKWLPGLFSASLFILIHGRDGLAQGGQRDLTMAVLLLAATASLFAAVRRNSPGLAAAFGLLSGLAVTIKPTTLPVTLAQVLLAGFVLYHRRSPWRACALPAALAYLIGPAIALTFLLREHALAAFLAGFHGIVPYYASLGHRPLSYILLHSLSPMQALVLLWLILLALRSHPLQYLHDWQRTSLAVGALFGLIDCLIQQRAFPYYRYPLLAFLLPLIAIDLDRALRQPIAAAATPLRARIAALIALAAVSYGGFFLAPQSALFIHRYRWWETDFISSLQQNLNALGGAQLSGHIQCIDGISGCDNVLYRMRLEQSTGILADYVLFGPDSVPIIHQTRQQFAADILALPPQVIVVTSPLHIDGPDNFQKLDRWPAFAQFLATRYTLQTEWSPTRTARWWTREETPASYRIYVLRH